ncbi:MAG: hypothetical protein FWG82_01540 [Oscillospiraceae bacterium]|nr:hypothetical protein [Oscillospiraceae bacterium]
MLTNNNVQSVLDVMIGMLDPSVQEQELYPLAAASALWIYLKLEDPEDINNVRVIMAAGLHGLYSYMVKRRINGDGLVSFKAGDLSIDSKGDPLEAAKQMRDEALADVQHFFKKEGAEPEPPLPEPDPDPEPIDDFVFECI